jgi:hypothetical protein
MKICSCLCLIVGHPGSTMAVSAPGANSSALLPPSSVSGFTLRQSCSTGSSGAALRVYDVSTPIIVRLPRKKSEQAVQRGPPVQCRRKVIATYNVTCGRGADAQQVQVTLQYVESDSRQVVSLGYDARPLPGVLRRYIRRGDLRQVSGRQ